MLNTLGLSLGLVENWFKGNTFEHCRPTLCSKFGKFDACQYGSVPLWSPWRNKARYLGIASFGWILVLANVAIGQDRGRVGRPRRQDRHMTVENLSKAGPPASILIDKAGLKFRGPVNRDVVAESSDGAESAKDQARVADKGSRVVQENGRPFTVTDLALGRKLFEREWLPNDPLCHGGDGLGPAYNEKSCLACHSQGKPGGAGPNDRNVELLSLNISGLEAMTIPNGLMPMTGKDPASDGPPRPVNVIRNIAFSGSGYRMEFGKFHDPERGDVMGKFVFVTPDRTLKGKRITVANEKGRLTGTRFHISEDDDTREMVIAGSDGVMRGHAFVIRPEDSVLKQVHPGLCGARSVVLPRANVNSAYASRRSAFIEKIRSQEGLVIVGGSLSISVRSATPLFGMGVIDSLPDEAFIDTAERQAPEVRGRCRKMKDGSIGRFGWKAQVSSLQEFVIAACANELGLEVPGHHQPPTPLTTSETAEVRGLDLTQDECNSLAAYVGSLPPPVIRYHPNHEDKLVQSGYKLFESIGCADCHVRKLGDIEGIYSDLLLHDMGSELDTTGEYYGLPDGTGSLSSEWRTPPLWGFHESGPYLHDGRAKTLGEAVRFHGGQAGASATRYANLSHAAQKSIAIFLDSLSIDPSLVGEKRETSESAVESRIETNFRAAHNLDRMGKSKGALEFYRKVVSESPNSVRGKAAAIRIRELEKNGK
ncbi:di-heme oxidoredictase family protein [Singulisphaera rosea]